MVSAKAVRLYSHMYNNRNADWTCTMSRAMMGEFLDRKLRTVSTVLQELTELGWIERNQGFGSRAGETNKLLLR